MHRVKQQQAASEISITGLLLFQLCLTQARRQRH